MNAHCSQLVTNVLNAFSEYRPAVVDWLVFEPLLCSSYKLDPPKTGDPSIPPLSAQFREGVRNFAARFAKELVDAFQNS